MILLSAELILGILVSRDVCLLQNPFSYVHKENGRRRGRSWHRDMLV